MNRFIQRLIDSLKTRPILLAHELNGTPNVLSTRKMCLRWTIGDDEEKDPKIMEEVHQAAEFEAEAEWACNLLELARQAVTDVTEIDCTKVDREIYQNHIDEAIRAKAAGFVNPILIVNPSLLTVLGCTGQFFPATRGIGPHLDRRIVKFVGYYRNIPVHVDQYASDRSIDLICEKGWFTAEADYGIRATSPRVDPNTFEEVVGFETDAKFTIDVTKVKGIVAKMAYLGFI